VKEKSREAVLTPECQVRVRELGFVWVFYFFVLCFIIILYYI
jgi:hypothetical protein